MSRNVSIVRRLITAVLVMLIIVIPGQSALAADKFENSNFYLSLKKQVANLALDSGASCEYDPDTETITIYMYVSPEMENQLRLQAETDVVKGTFEMMESLSTDIVDQCEKEGYHINCTIKLTEKDVPNKTLYAVYNGRVTTNELTSSDDSIVLAGKGDNFSNSAFYKLLVQSFESRDDAEYHVSYDVDMKTLYLDVAVTKEVLDEINGDLDAYSAFCEGAWPVAAQSVEMAKDLCSANGFDVDCAVRMVGGEDNDVVLFSTKFGEENYGKAPDIVAYFGEGTDSAAPTDKAVTATGTAQGIDGDIKVRVVADETTIYSVEILEQHELPEIGGAAVERLPEMIVAANTYNVDGVAGATISSRGIREAVKDALTSAGFDLKAFSEPSETITSSGATGSSKSSSSFTNKFGNAKTKCAYPGCNNYIASSGDTSYCATDSNRCLNCGKYIDSDAVYCLDCIRKSVTGSSSSSSNSSGTKRNGYDLPKDGESFSEYVKRVSPDTYQAIQDQYDTAVANGW